MYKIRKYFAAFLFACLILSGCSAPKGPLVSYYYSDSNGYGGWTTEYYMYEENGSVVARMEEFDYSDRRYSFEKRDVDRKDFEWVDSLLKDAGVHKWKSDYQPVFEILDGDNWSVRVQFADDTIDSGGYMAGPRKDPTTEINERIRVLVDYKKIFDN